MRAVLLVAVLVALAEPALAKIYVCDVLHVYGVENGELVSIPVYSTWPKIVFDDDTGIFKYGREGQWTEERMRVMSKGTEWSAAGYYMHKDTIFSAIRVLAWANPPSFIWDAGAVGAVYTGTRKIYGN